MSEKMPDLPIVHLPWSAWQAITGRLDALESDMAALDAREKARDVALIVFGNSLSECPESAAPNLAYAIERLCRPLLAAAPPPPAAAPDVIERVRKALSDALGCLGPEGYVPVFGKPKTDALREALRLLGDGVL